nr:succinate dehydrogenase iron-sulfur subunit [Anaerolineae bacterium]
MSGNGSYKTAIIRVQRFNPDTDSHPTFTDYTVEARPGMTLLDALHTIKTEQDGSLTFRRSCRHAICGSCGMNVNGVNILACESPLKDHLDAEGRVTIRPLPYLPILKDLVVDRDSFWEQYHRVKPWMIPPDELPEREFRVMPEEVASYRDAEHCIMCGICYSACPVINVDKGFLGPHAMLKGFLRVLDSRDAHPDEHLVESSTVWDCTTCYLCCEQCPKELDPGKTSPDLRARLVEDSKVPRKLGNALTSTFRNNNPFEMAHSDRQAWQADLPVKDALSEAVDALYFTCCMSCYDPRAQKASQAMLRVMDAAGVTLGTLGSNEACCGSEIRRLGELGLFEMIVEERTELLSAAQTNRVVTSSPHCYDVYSNHYPGLETTTQHYAQYIAALMDEGKLKLSGVFAHKVTYHDPCYLGIQNGVFEDPRRVLQAIEGLELVEMEHHAENSLCCGGGGGRMWFEGHETATSHMSHERVREALETGAEVLATACPFCMNMLDDAIKTLGVTDRIRVMDIMEIVEEAI